ncbi:MAG TPA: hypothetical protein VG963_22640 [Polyangiaceae bacterium]|nr:hypothetical protein [Polyangiaceae bacterium]
MMNNLARKLLTVGQYVVTGAALLSIPYVIVGVASFFEKPPKKEHERIAEYAMQGTCKENHAAMGAEYEGRWTIYREIATGRKWDAGFAIRQDHAIDVAHIRDHAYEPPLTLLLDSVTAGKLEDGAAVTFAATSQHSIITDDGREHELPGYASTCEMRITRVASGEPTPKQPP